jgi:hypothetical protein
MTESKSEKPISLKIMKQAFTALDKKLNAPLILIMGGGGAMISAHDYPLATTDVDAIPKGLDVHEIAELSKQIAQELHLPSDWLNCYFSTFAFVILPDYAENLIEVFKGKFLTVSALSKEDMLIMKCFAHRPKDVGHAKSLVKKGANLKKVEQQIEFLKSKKIPEAKAALDFLDDILEQLE